MSPTVMAIIMIVVVVAAIIWNKIPMNFIMFVIPVVCALILGYNVSEISSAILGQISSVMGSSGWMLLFGLIFFTMLTESGMFDIIIGKLLGIVGKKLNVFWVLILTAAISAIAYLTANMSTTYLIVFPIMIPLFKRDKMDQRWAFIVCQSAIAMMCWLPWGIGVVNSAAMASTAVSAAGAGADIGLFLFGHAGGSIPGAQGKGCRRGRGHRQGRLSHACLRPVFIPGPQIQVDAQQ